MRVASPSKTAFRRKPWCYSQVVAASLGLLMTDIVQRQSLITVPDDILLEIFSFLEAGDVVSLSQVARKLHELSKCFIVWHNVFLNLLFRARYIDLLAIDQKPLKDADVHELKKSVILTASAEKNWLRDRPKTTGPSQTIDFKRAIRTNICLEQSAYITKFTSKHLLLPLEDGSVLGWNLKDNVPAGSHEMDPDCIIVDLALEKSTRTLIGLVGKVAPVRFNDSLGMHVRLTVLRIGIPETGSSQPLSFERSSQLTLLAPFCSEVHLLDASRRMLCAAFSCTTSKQMAILVVFDWETEDAAIINTGIPYNYGRSLIGIHLSDAGDFLVLLSEDEGNEIRRWYRLADLEPSPATWNALEYESQIIMNPTRQEVFKWKNELGVFSKAEGTNPYLFWAIDQLPGPPYPDILPLVSTIVLYVNVPATVLDPKPSDRTWRIAQYYSDKNGPCAPARTVATLRNPALSPNDPDEQGIPILCMSFNHFGWVEEVENEGVKQRSLKLITFPDPGTTYDSDLADSARALDIPSDVLDDAYHVLLDATQGLIIVATVHQALHVYHY